MPRGAAQSNQQVQRERRVIRAQDAHDVSKCASIVSSEGGGACLGLAQGQRSEAPETCAAAGPHRLDAALERGRGRSKETRDHAPPCERCHPGPDRRCCVGEVSSQRLGKPDQRGMRRRQARNGRDVRHAFGRPEPSPALSAAQHHTVLEEEPLSVARGRAAVEQIEAPRLAARRASGGPGVAQDRRGARREIQLDTLDVPCSRRGNHVVGHVLEDRAFLEAEDGALDRGQTCAPVDARGARRRETDAAARAEIDARLQTVAAKDAARGIQEKERRCAGAVEVDRLERLKGEREAPRRQDRARSATLEGEAEEPVAPGPSRRGPFSPRRGARGGSSPRRGRRLSRPGDW